MKTEPKLSIWLWEPQGHRLLDLTSLTLPAGSERWTNSSLEGMEKVLLGLK